MATDAHAALFTTTDSRNTTKLSFFDLPGEIRELIYTYTALGPVFDSGANTLEVRSVYPVRLTFSIDRSTQQERTRLLLVSSRFATELRAVLFRKVRLIIREPRSSVQLDSNSLSRLYAFVQNLGPEIVHLRDLRVYCTTGDAASLRHAEQALGPVLALLHRKIIIVLVVTQLFVADPKFGSRKLSTIACRVGRDGRPEATIIG